MSWSTSKGFDFRGSLAFVTDPTNCYFVGLASTYPTTHTIGGDSVTYGWETAPSGSSDIVASGDARLSGRAFGFLANGTFRVDLPAAGNYTVNLALGDNNAAQTNQLYSVHDTASVLQSWGPFNTSQSNFYDAVSFLWSAANWPGSQSPSGTLTFATTIFRLVFLSTATYSTIAHLNINVAGGGPPPRGLFGQTPMNGLGVGGSYFPNPIGAPVGFTRRDRIFVPERLAA
jgi:hypothetical protein